MKFGSRVFVTISFLFLFVSCTNVFTSFSDQETDEALFFEAQQAINALEYSRAITIIETMSVAGQAKRETRLLKSSAFGGLCGLNFLGFLDGIASGDSTQFFVTLMNTMANADATKQSNCESAVDEIRLISTTATDRTNDENILMTVVALGTLGTILNKVADADNDNTVDGGFDHCTSFSDAEVNRLVASMAETFQSLEAIGSSSVASDSMSDLSGACTALAGETPPLDFCSKTDPDTVTADERQGMKGVVGSDESIGLGNCNGSVVACANSAGC